MMFCGFVLSKRPLKIITSVFGSPDGPERYGKLIVIRAFDGEIPDTRKHRTIVSEKFQCVIVSCRRVFDICQFEKCPRSLESFGRHSFPCLLRSEERRVGKEC